MNSFFQFETIVGIGMLVVFGVLIFNNIRSARRPVPEAGGVKVIQEGTTQRVRFSDYTVVSLILLAIIVDIFFSCIWPALHDSIPLFKTNPLLVECIALTIVLLLPVGFFVFMQRRITSGRLDLVIDYGSKTVTLPQTFQRRTLMVVPFVQVFAITVERTALRNGDDSSYIYMPTLVLRNAPNQRLAEMDNRRAAAFAAWLAEKIGVPYDGAHAREKIFNKRAARL